MRKNLLALTPLSLLLLAMTGGVQAASNATIQITGNVVAATCDVRSSVLSLDLGNFSAKDFVSPGVPVIGSERQFSVELSNCQNISSNDHNTAYLKVVGTTIPGNLNIFNGSDINAGVMLSEISKPNDYLKSGEEQAFPRVTA